jgi:hypothetical protein
MIRNLKVLMLAAMATAALGAVMASAAQAEPHFFFPGAGATGVTTVKVTADDEEGKNPKTGHQVFDISKADGTGVKSITCNQIHADTKVTGETTTELTFETPTFTGECQFVGQSVVVENTGCEFILTADTKLHIVNDTALKCEHLQKPIHFSIPGCKVEVGKQTIEKGITHHEVITNGKKAVTVEANITELEYKATGVNCEYGTTKNGRYTTGNSVITATRPEGTVVDVEWTG